MHRGWGFAARRAGARAGSPGTALELARTRLAAGALDTASLSVDRREVIRPFWRTRLVRTPSLGRGSTVPPSRIVVPGWAVVVRFEFDREERLVAVRSDALDNRGE